MGPAVVLSQDLTEIARAVRDGAMANLATGDRKTGNGHRKAAGMRLVHYLYYARVVGAIGTGRGPSPSPRSTRPPLMPRPLLVSLSLRMYAAPLAP